MQNLDSLLAGYTTTPVYYADYGNEACLFELRINDVIVDELTHPGSIGLTSATINPYILRSGKNKVTVKLYPNPGAKMIWTNLYPTFQPFKLAINYVDFKLPEEEQVIVDVFKMPELRINPDDGGIPYFEYEGEFEAKVPYSITSWSDCIDLREVDNIEERVVMEYKRVRQMMAEKRFNELKEYYALRDYELSITMYESQEMHNTGWRNYIEEIKDKSPDEFQLIEDYKLVFNANGRIATLKSTKKKGFPSALLWLKQEKGNPEYEFCHFDLHLGIRKGTNEFVAIP